MQTKSRRNCLVRGRTQRNYMHKIKKPSGYVFKLDSDLADQTFAVYSRLYQQENKDIEKTVQYLDHLLLAEH